MQHMRKEFIIVIAFFIMAITIFILSPTSNSNTILQTSSYESIPTQSPTNTSKPISTPSNTVPKPTETLKPTETPKPTVTATPTITTTTTPEKYYKYEIEGVNNGGKRSKFAYSFYITKDEYFCAALINANNIRKWSTQDIVIHMVDEKHSEIIFNNFKHIPNVYFRFVKNILPRSGNESSFWIQTWNKFWVFKLTDYERIIHLDADTYLLKNLDHLFDLPDATLAMPRAYWLSQPFSSSLLMVLKPSDKLYNDIISHGNENNSGGNSWDMDILNNMFKFSPDFIMLPGIYGLLHGEFSTREKKWLGDDYHATWDRAPLFHWSTFKPWDVKEESADVSSYGELYKKTWTLWRDGVNNFCKNYNN